jgi:hypothetical protein
VVEILSFQRISDLFLKFSSIHFEGIRTDMYVVPVGLTRGFCL